MTLRPILCLIHSILGSLEHLVKVLGGILNLRCVCGLEHPEPVPHYKDTQLGE